MKLGSIDLGRRSSDAGISDLPKRWISGGISTTGTVTQLDFGKNEKDVQLFFRLVDQTTKNSLRNYLMETVKPYGGILVTPDTEDGLELESTLTASKFYLSQSNSSISGYKTLNRDSSGSANTQSYYVNSASGTYKLIEEFATITGEPDSDVLGNLTVFIRSIKTAGGNGGTWRAMFFKRDVDSNETFLGTGSVSHEVGSSMTLASSSLAGNHGISKSDRIVVKLEATPVDTAVSMSIATGGTAGSYLSGAGMYLPFSASFVSFAADWAGAAKWDVSVNLRKFF